MKIVIFTSSDHVYANFIITGLIKNALFHKHTVTILEQDSIVPNKPKITGLLKYIKLSGWTYFISQVLKQFFFQAARIKAVLIKDTMSTFYPYSRYKQPNMTILKLNGLKREDNQKYISGLHPDLVLSILSKEIIPEKILAMPKFGCVNFHPAPLPNYKGVSPIFWALANGEKEFGATLHYINNGIDTGRIIYRDTFKHATPTSEHAIYLRCASSGVKQLTAFLQLKSLTLVKTIPNSKKGSYYSLPTKEAVNRFLTAGNVFFTPGEFL